MAPIVRLQNDGHVVSALLTTGTAICVCCWSADGRVKRGHVVLISVCRGRAFSLLALFIVLSAGAAIRETRRGRVAGLVVRRTSCFTADRGGLWSGRGLCRLGRAATV